VRPTWALKPGLTDRLVVGRNVTLTLSTSVQSSELQRTSLQNTEELVFGPSASQYSSRVAAA
jgi:hypothetical protein